MSRSSRPGVRQVSSGLPIRRPGKVVVGDANMKAQWLLFRNANSRSS